MSTRTHRRGLHRALWSTRAAMACVSLASVGCRAAGGHGAAHDAAPATQPGTTPDPNRTCNTPGSQGTSAPPLCLRVETALGVLGGGPVFWHLYTYPTSADAAAARGPHGTVAESFGKYWLFTIGAADWHPTAGERVAVIGPLSITRDTPYTARYMEAVFPPGFQTPPGAHRHPGPEAWYVLTGAQCLEPPAGPMVTRAGESAVVPEGPPMAISGVGPETRRAVVLVLHPTGEPYSSRAPDWTPKGLCPR
jgi:quercetin dioxygenase-like cupin family protein